MTRTPIMPRRPPHPPEDELHLLATALADVTPLPGREALGPAIGAPAKTTTGLRRPSDTPRMPGAPQGHDLDRRTRTRFERGEMAIAATIDLHGSGQAAARTALHQFITSSWSRQLRCVLVITGKGRDGAGVLKNRLRDWLAEPAVRPMVLEVSSARPMHGGGGAFYVLLRRQRGL